MQNCTLEIINQCSFPARVHYLLLRHIFWLIYNCWHKNIVVIFTWKEILYVYFYKFCYKCFLKLFSIIIILFKLVSCMNDTFYIFHKKKTFLWWLWKYTAARKHAMINFIPPKKTKLSVVTTKMYCCKNIQLSSDCYGVT